MDQRKAIKSSNEIDRIKNNIQNVWLYTAAAAAATITTRTLFVPMQQSNYKFDSIGRVRECALLYPCIGTCVCVFCFMEIFDLRQSF